jgi:hypothetical protein
MKVYQQNPLDVAWEMYGCKILVLVLNTQEDTYQGGARKFIYWIALLDAP